MELGLPTNTEEDMNLQRVRCIHANVVTKVLQFVFEKGTLDRPSCVPLFQYYRDKGVEVSRLKKSLHARQINVIESDASGKSFDISLLYTCLLYGSHRLPCKTDDKWNEGDDSFESLITSLRNKTDAIVFEKSVYHNELLITESQEVKVLLTKVLNLARQFYDISSAIIDQENSDIESSINRYLHNDLTLKDSEECKEKLIFPVQSELVYKEGVEDVLEQYDKDCEGTVSTVNQKFAVRLPVDDIFTSIKLVSNSSCGQENTVTYENLFQDENQCEDDSLLVVNGTHGVGKTTLVKKLISDWKSGECAVKHLDAYDHVLKAECRKSDITSFRDILNHLMPLVSKKFQGDDLEKVVAAQKVLLILDGFNDTCKSSLSLFDEVLRLKKDFGIGVLVTIRPERMTYVKHLLKRFNIKGKHIQILGIPSEKRDEFVTNYHSEIARKHSSIQAIDGLLAYLKQTTCHLSYIWTIPFNLAALTELWAFNILNISNISTTPKLYLELYTLYRTKLIELLNHDSSEPHMTDKLVSFFETYLLEESLISLKEGHSGISREAYSRLIKVSGNLKVSSDLLVSSYLEKVATISDIACSFSNKGFQEFLAAYYIWKEIEDMNQPIDVEEVVAVLTKALSNKGISEQISKFVIEKTRISLKTESSLKTADKDCSCALRYACQSLKGNFPNCATSTVIRDVLKRIHESTKYDISKFQGMLIALVGIFYLEGDEDVEDSVKVELLKLLKDSGVKEKDTWITILNLLKCDALAASFMVNQCKVLEGTNQVTDSSISAYLSLLRSIKLPLKYAQKVIIDVDIKSDDISGVDKLLKLVSIHKFRIQSIMINDRNFVQYTSLLKTMQKSLKNSNEVVVDVHVNKDREGVSDLMVQLKKKGFTIKTQEVKAR